MATVSFRLNHPNKPGERSILVELYINSSIKPEISTGEKVLKNHWNGSRANSKAPDYHRLNDNLSRIERELTQLWRDNQADLSKIKSLMPAVVRGKSSTSEKKRIFEALDKFLSHCKDTKSANTVKMYTSLCKKLEAFDKVHPIDLESLDVKFYDKFKTWLYEQPNPNYPRHSLFLSDTKDHYILSGEPGGLPVGLFDDTVFKYFINLKAFLDWAEKRDYKVHPSYKIWEIIKREYEPISLSTEELDKLTSAKLSSTQLDIARDYLLLECYTGQRISDIKRFDQRDYVDFKWTFKQKKGERLSNKNTTVHFVGYSQPALFILAKYNFKLPVVSEQNLNNNIKDICESAGINEQIFIERWAGSKKIRIYGKKSEFITTHTGRKTFITLALSNGMPREMVMELTGIKTEKTLNHYKGKSEDKAIEMYLKAVSANISLMKKAQ